MFGWLRRLIWGDPKPESRDFDTEATYELFTLKEDVSAVSGIPTSEDILMPAASIDREEWMKKTKLKIDIDAYNLYNIKLDRRKSQKHMIDDLINELNKPIV